MSKDDGGPAFPEPERPQFDGTTFTLEHGYRNPGMSLRDWFAGMAMRNYAWDDPEIERELLAEECYKAADAMLQDSEVDPQRTEEALDVAREALTKIAESDFDLEHNFSDYDTLCALVFPALNRINEIMGEEDDG